MITRPLWTLPGKSTRLWIADDAAVDLADRETVRQAWKRLFEGIEIPTPTADWNSGDVYYRLLPTGHVLVESLWGNSEIRLIRQAEHARLLCKHDWKIIGAAILGPQTPGSLTSGFEFHGPATAGTPGSRRATGPGIADSASQSSDQQVHNPRGEDFFLRPVGLQSPASQSPAQPPLMSLLFGSQISETPRSRISEFQIPEQQIPRSHIPGQSILGSRIPESQILGSQPPGSQTPGSPKATGPRATGPRATDPRATDPKATGPGATGPTPGSRTPESYTLGSVTIGTPSSEPETPDASVIDVLYVCEACSSWTYHQMKFVGYQRESLEHRLGDVIDEPVGNGRR